MQRPGQMPSGKGLLTADDVQQDKIARPVAHRAVDIGAVGFKTQFMPEPGGSLAEVAGVKAVTTLMASSPCLWYH
jgi:hypothetical protein